MMMPNYPASIVKRITNSRGRTAGERTQRKYITPVANKNVESMNTDKYSSFNINEDKAKQVAENVIVC